MSGQDKGESSLSKAVSDTATSPSTAAVIAAASKPAAIATPEPSITEDFDNVSSQKQEGTSAAAKVDDETPAASKPQKGRTNTAADSLDGSEQDGKEESIDASAIALIRSERSLNGQQKKNNHNKKAHEKKVQKVRTAPASASAAASHKRDYSKNKNENSTLKSVRMATSIEDISSLRLWKGVIAEFVGTLLLTLVGCGSCIDLNPLSSDVTDTTLSALAKPVPVVQIAFCFGLSVATIVWAIGHVSGGHINPAVTSAMLATRKISLAKGIFFILFQLLGSVVGAGILYGLIPEGYHGMLGVTMVNDKLSAGQGVGVELFITFVLVFVVFASCDSKRKDLKGSAPLTIGLSVTMCHLFAITFTGSSMNTARSFGPALVMGNWATHWVYWVGPILGGVAAGVLYDNLFAMNASLNKAKACMLSSDYDNDSYKARKIKVRIIEEEDNEDDEYEDGEGEDNDGIALAEKESSDPSKV